MITEEAHYARVDELLASNNRLLERARTAERQLELAPSPPWVADFLNRRTTVESVLRDIHKQKRGPLSADECLVLANLLSVPSDFGSRS